jgi:hypothetical protein
MRVSVMAAALWAAAVVPAFAQQAPPLPRVVLDARLFTSGVGQDATTATALGVDPSGLPSRANGAAVGLTFYPFDRSGGRTLGLGGEAILGRARASIVDATGLTPTIDVETRLEGFAGEVSLNFGHRDGWSYLSAGIGPMRIESYTGDLAPASAPAGRLTPNVGAGARWFSSRHVAFCFDLRFYSTQRVATTDLFAGRERKNLLVLSAGLAIR